MTGAFLCRILQGCVNRNVLNALRDNMRKENRVMAKALLNSLECYASVEKLSEILETYGVICERKKNGNIWVNCKQKAFWDYDDLKRSVYRILHERDCFQMMNDSEVHYSFFDHSAYFTAVDGTTVSLFSPFWGDMSWPALIKPLWERGYYVAIYNRCQCQSRNVVVLVRKRKEEDEMFRFQYSGESF